MRGRANLRAYRVWKEQQRAPEANAVDVEVRSAESQDESPLPLLTQQSQHPTSGSPLRRSPRLRVELPDDDDDDADVAVASIFYGEGNVDVQLNLGEDLDAVAGGNDDVDNENEIEVDDEEYVDEEYVSNQHVDEEEGGAMEEEAMEEEVEEGWSRVSKKSKSDMNDVELFAHFDKHLQRKRTCGNKACSCLRILFGENNACEFVAKYLVWFDRQTKYMQDSIVLGWTRYASMLVRSPTKKIQPQTTHQPNRNYFRLPMKSDEFDYVPEQAYTHLLCTKGMKFILDIGRRRYTSIFKASEFTSVMPQHKSLGSTNYNALVNDVKRNEPLMHHFEYLLNLGEVRATRVVATLVDGVQGHANREDTVEQTYLPISMGYRSCYRRYMASIGYKVRTTGVGVAIVEGVEGKPIDKSEYVSYPTYFYVWKKSFPNLKVSRPAEDICAYCYAFANRHRYLASHSLATRVPEDGEDADKSDVDDKDEGATSGGEDETEMTTDSRSGHSSAVLTPEAARNKIDEEREMMLLEAANHIKMARAQRALYQEKAAAAVASTRAGKPHGESVYCFVVDYGQNMELPIYNSEQPGVTYYFSPLSVYNLGMVNHGHDYGDDRGVSEHMHCHVYHEGVGKKGANNVSSLILKTLRLLNLLREDSVGGELNIVFDNCSGQNKNNTVLKLAAWIMAMGYFKVVNFIFLVVGHTKNSADRLFNSLKGEYRSQNIFTMEGLIESLNRSESVTVHPAGPEDFYDYDKLLNAVFRDLAGKIKKNHIFSCNDDGSNMILRQSNLVEHAATVHKLRKKTWNFENREQFFQYSENMLMPVRCLGLNPYKAVEMWKNYRPNVPDEYHSNWLYLEPSAEVKGKVKDEKGDRSEFRAALKAKKYADKERVEKNAFGDGEEAGL